jgi:Flp pilus assembly protein TadD
MEALAQAQSLWNSGAHQEAIGLAREALVTAERTNLASPSAGNKSVLASLARELARMEMAQGRVREALEMLTRLEPALFTNADVWAMRGNAAQRLGRHAESVAAYVMALRLRPNEARWMLAAAISLANQGQMADAAELTERARVGGVLTPEVAAYLKQLGVPMRER